MRTITVKRDTKLKDLKVGDLVMTAEVMRVTGLRCDGGRKRNDWIECAHVLPKCECKGCRPRCRHTHIHHIGWGQQGVVKIVRQGEGERPKLIWTDEKGSSYDKMRRFEITRGMNDYTSGLSGKFHWRLINANPILSPHYVICGTVSILIGKFKTRERAKAAAELIAKG